jgi:hypothetical protein
MLVFEMALASENSKASVKKDVSSDWLLEKEMALL